VIALSRLHPEDAPRASASGVRADDARTAWRGLSCLLKSPYLQGIAAFTFFHTLFGTVLYFTQANLVSEALPARDDRTAYFATVDQIGNALTLMLQLFVTGRLIQRLGTGFALMSQPLVALVACAGLGWMIQHGASAFGDGWTHAWPPALFAVATARVLLSAANYATAKPARESLYTVVPREAKYASKSFIDTFVYRGGDLVAAWSFDLVNKTLAVALGPIALGAAPLSVMWLVIGLVLGRKQRELGGGGPS
jgi:AAA family ATP:ADP antiporter